MHQSLLQSLENKQEHNLRELLVRDKRQLARLNSCFGQMSGKWISAFPCSWWPKMSDEEFILGLRFRCGIRVVQPNQKCMHASCKDKTRICNKVMDVWGDHCVVCQFGGHPFIRHGALNNIVAEAGRAAGYVALIEPVIPDFSTVRDNGIDGRTIHEGRIDVELFGHHVAPNRLLDGTIHHPATSSVLSRAAKEVGVAALDGEKVKAKRYPPVNGKAVVACSMETWGYCGESLDALLRELAVLATRRQVERGVTPTKWLLKWQTHLSIAVAQSIGRCLIDALPMPERYVLSTRSRSFAFGGSEMLDESGDSIPNPLFSESSGIARGGIA